jgi:NADH:ubiquinone oxidoreductase subunit F (NADH-binding)
VCTITGAVARSGVAEIAMGTTLRQAIDLIGGGPEAGRSIGAVLVGVSSAALTGEQLDTALTYETMAAAGSGLGSAGFVVIADDSDVVGVAAGVSHFLAVESCGQCTACKQDGLTISALLGRLAGGDASVHDLETIDARLETITDGARCSLASQHRTVVGGLMHAFAPWFRAHLEPESAPVAMTFIAEMLSLDDDVAMLDSSFVDKQPDWTRDPLDSGKTPVDRYSDHRSDGTSSSADRAVRP